MGEEKRGQDRVSQGCERLWGFQGVRGGPRGSGASRGFAECEKGGGGGRKAENGSLQCIRRRFFPHLACACDIAITHRDELLMLLHCLAHSNSKLDRGDPFLPTRTSTTH